MRWKDIDLECKERLKIKIKAEWILPEGDNVDQVMENQCKVLYRQWRYRLKEKFFDGNTIDDAVKNCPPDVNPDDWKWLVENHWGTQKQKRKTRHPLTANQTSEAYQEGIEEENGPLESPPEYVTSWEKTKRRKDHSMDKFAEEKLEELKQLHQQELELYGADKLTVEEAYIKVLGTCSGYINGLGFGPKPPKRSKDGAFSEENVEFTQQMAEQFDHLEKTSKEREYQLNGQIQDLFEEIEKMKKEAQEREEKIRPDLQEMEKQLLNLQK